MCLKGAIPEAHAAKGQALTAAAARARRCAKRPGAAMEMGRRRRPLLAAQHLLLLAFAACALCAAASAQEGKMVFGARSVLSVGSWTRPLDLPKPAAVFALHRAHTTCIPRLPQVPSPAPPPPSLNLATRRQSPDCDCARRGPRPARGQRHAGAAGAADQPAPEGRRAQAPAAAVRL